jgi:hypothetical protein
MVYKKYVEVNKKETSYGTTLNTLKMRQIASDSIDTMYGNLFGKKRKLIA